MQNSIIKSRQMIKGGNKNGIFNAGGNDNVCFGE